MATNHNHSGPAKVNPLLSSAVQDVYNKLWDDSIGVAPDTEKALRKFAKRQKVTVRSVVDAAVRRYLADPPIAVKVVVEDVSHPAQTVAVVVTEPKNGRKK